MTDLKTSTRIGRTVLRVSLIAAVLGVAACSSDALSDLETYVQEVKARPAGRIAPLPEFESYETYVYGAAELRDPFIPKEEAKVTDAKRDGPGLRPDTSRNKEALEQFPLDALQFVGLLERQGDTWAIIKAPDDLVYRAQVGNHVGQNYGKVTAISESRVDILEIVPDGLGGWMNRDAAIAITE